MKLWNPVVLCNLHMYLIFGQAQAPLTAAEVAASFERMLGKPKLDGGAYDDQWTAIRVIRLMNLLYDQISTTIDGTTELQKLKEYGIQHLKQRGAFEGTKSKRKDRLAGAGRDANGDD